MKLKPIESKADQIYALSIGFLILVALLVTLLGIMGALP